WRAIATTTTILIVYFFFDRLDLAIAAGAIETVLKIGLFWMHERAWFKIRWGKKRIEPFNLWFTGLPLSGKTTIADKVFKELEKLQIPLERIDLKDIRDLIPDIGYSREERNQHMHRIGNLICTLQNNSISTVASFVSPYKESRKTIREMVKNNIVVHVKADIYPRLGPTMEWDTGAARAIVLEAGMDLKKYADQEYAEHRYNKQNLLNDSFVVLSD
ncbi:MAG TPA: adenylyl-sulfate kinase, partial [Cycloclasticus sp.]|nr:adenylyl-sulfate kinase [Cycloclasticus sp.]